MTTRFTIRPKPMEGECLSGYLMRIAYANCMNAKSVFTYMCKKDKTKSIINKNLNQIDDFPEKVVYIDILLELTNLARNKIEAMTFTPVYKKFFDNISTKEKYLNVMNQQKEIKNRRFCPKCIKETGYYKLIWQVNDIEICNKHFMKLTDKCPICGIEQPYVTDKLNEFKCFKCGSYLYDVNATVIKEIYYVEQQLKKYKQWYYLLDYDKNSFNNIQGLSKIKSLGIALLYVSKFNCGTLKSTEIKCIDLFSIYAITKYINNRTDQMRITVYRLLYCLTYLEINIEDFFNYDVPEEYVKYILSMHQNENKILKDSLKTKKEKILKKKKNCINEDNNFNECIVKKVDSYIASLEKSDIKIFSYNIYNNLKITYKRMYEKYPYLSKLISQKVADYEIRRQDFLIEKYSEMIENVIKEMYIDEENVTYKSISEKIGISRMAIYRNIKLIEVISKMKDSLGIS